MYFIAVRRQRWLSPSTQRSSSVSCCRDKAFTESSVILRRRCAMSKVPRLIIQGIVLLVITSVSGWAMAQQQCGEGTTVTIDPYLSNYNKTQQGAVAYAWTRAHFDGSTGQWGHKSNPNETIASTTDGTKAQSGPYISDYDAPHPGQFDTANAGASAQCAGANCSSPT